jgi:hypothetical protein
MDTTIANKAGDDVEFLKVNEKDQKDGDALIISGSSDKAGAQFQLWYRFDGTDGTKDGNPVDPTEKAAIHVRNVNIWFKPIDQVKITVGNVAIDSYKEQIFWWHGVYGAKPGSWGAFGGEYIGTQAGVKAEIKPIDNLTFEAALFHHERYDGKGYPNGKKEDEIPLIARIVAVADAYDAMSNDRPYRNKLLRERIRDELINNTSQQFDPEIVRAFLDIMGEKNL